MFLLGWTWVLGSSSKCKTTVHFKNIILFETTPLLRINKKNQKDILSLLMAFILDLGWNWEIIKARWSEMSRFLLRLEPKQASVKNEILTDVKTAGGINNEEPCREKLFLYFRQEPSLEAKSQFWDYRGTRQWQTSRLNSVTVKQDVSAVSCTVSKFFLPLWLKRCSLKI